MKLKRNKDKKPLDLSTFRFSVSSVKSYRQCGLKFYREKVEKLKAEKETTHHRWLGRVVHNSIYQHIALYVVKETPPEKVEEPNEEAVVEAPKFTKEWELAPYSYYEYTPTMLFEAMWEGESKDPYMSKIIEMETGKRPNAFIKNKKLKALTTDDKEELEFAWKEQALKMVLNGVKVLNDVHKITKVEHKLEFTFMNYPFVGYIDILAEDENGLVEFYDFKTSWTKPREDKVKEDMQFLLYSYALKKLLNLDYYPKGHLVHLRSGSLVSIAPDDTDIELEGDRFSKDLNSLADNVFYKNMYDVLCPYCDFYKMCYGEEAKFS